MMMMQFRGRLFNSTWQSRGKKTTRAIKFSFIKFFLRSDLSNTACVTISQVFGPAYHSLILKLISFWSSLVYETRNSIHQEPMTIRSCIHLSVPQSAFHEVLCHRIIGEFISTHLLATCQECFLRFFFLYMASGTSSSLEHIIIKQTHLKHIFHKLNVSADSALSAQLCRRAPFWWAGGRCRFEPQPD